MKQRKLSERPQASLFFFSEGAGLLARMLEGAQRLRASRPNAPDVWRTEWEGRPVLIKSYHHCSVPYRTTVGWAAMSREWQALTLMRGTGHAPAPVLRPLPWVAAMEFVEGTPLEALARGDVAASTLLPEAERLLEVMAERGVVHGDIGHDCWSVQGRESNLLWTADGRLVAIDFAGGWRLDAPRPWGTLARALRLHDELLLTKILYHWADESLQAHPAWRLPSSRTQAWWDLMHLLGKV